MGRRGRIWLIAALLLILVGFFSIVGLLTGRAKSVSRVVTERWAETVGPVEEVLARYPKRETNDAARDLVEVAASLGIEMGPRADEDLPRPTRELSKRFKRFKAGGAGWLKTQLSRSDGGTAETPPDVRRFLEESREPIERIKEILLADRDPEWIRDIGQLWASPVPNLIGHVDLTKLLISDCFFHLDRGAFEEADRSLEAAWRLNETLGDSPQMIVQIIRVSHAKMHAAAVRQLPWLEHWIPRLDGHRYREAFEAALFHEGWLWPQMDFGPNPDQDLTSKVQSFIVGPYMELATADASERWRRKIEQLSKLETLCSPEIDLAGIRLDIPMPWWNRFGNILPPNLESAVSRLVLAQQQIELTRKLLEIGAMRRKTGRWPDLDDAWLESSLCRGDRWIYTRDDESISLALSRLPDNPLERHSPVTWAFSLRAPPVRPESRLQEAVDRRQHPR